MILHDHKRVVIAQISRLAPGDDRVSYKVTDRDSKRVIGYVTDHKFSLSGMWGYRLADEKVWTVVSSTRKLAVDHLLSAWSPGGPFLV